MNYRNNNTAAKGRPKKKGLKGAAISNKKDCEMSKQIVRKTNDKIEDIFQSRKSCFILTIMNQLIFLLLSRIRLSRNSVMQILFYVSSLQNCIEQILLIIK